MKPKDILPESPKKLLLNCIISVFIKKNKIQFIINKKTTVSNTTWLFMYINKNRLIRACKIKEIASPSIPSIKLIAFVRIIIEITVKKIEKLVISKLPIP